MIVKGIIKTINFSENSCTVRLPLFETAAADGEVILDAIISIQPGLYNGYTEGDVVFVDFENNKLSQPIVVGKLFLGADKEAAAGAPSAMTVSNLKVTTQATLPVDTRLSLEGLGNIVPVEKGISSYHSLVDIIKALHQTETSVQQTIKDQSGTVANIIVEYLSQPVEQEAPTAENIGWSISSPDYRDGFAIWQKTTCYNHRGQALSTEIICLSSIASAVLYKVRCSTRVHAGTNQTENVKISAWVKLGTELETLDTSANICYCWSDGDGSALTDWTESGTHEVTLEPAQLRAQNLVIQVKHGSEVYEEETIMYAPLNSPVLHLSNEADVLLYAANGTDCLSATGVSSTATLYVNGDPLEATYVWEWDPLLCTCEHAVDEGGQQLQNTIIVTAINSTSAPGVATCTATVTLDGPFKGKSYSKDFTVTQTKIGTSIISQDTYYALIHNKHSAGSIKTPPTTGDLIVRDKDGNQLNTRNESQLEEWSLTPPEHTPDTNGWKYWTTVKTTYSTSLADFEFSPPIISEDLSGVYSLAQGKTTNYYGNFEPTRNPEPSATQVYKPNLRVDDCWFDTSYKEISAAELATLDFASKYINYYVGEGSTKTLVTSSNYTTLSITPKTTKAYTKGALKQCIAIAADGTATWEDIGDEIVTNKLTATYINALDITAKKIKILNGDGNTTLFEADGIGISETPKVQIGGYNVVGSTLTTGTEADKNQIILDGTNTLASNGARLTIGENFKVLADGTVIAKNLYLEDKTEDSTTAAGQLEAISVRVNNIEADYVKAGTLEAELIAAKKIEIKDDTNNIIFKADGREKDENGDAIDAADRVQVGGFTVANNKLYTGSNTNYVELGTEAIKLGGGDPTVTSSTPTFSVSKAGYVTATSGKIGGFNISGTGITSDNSALQLGSDGTLYATSANIEGSIYADNGKIAGLEISPTALSSDYLQISDQTVWFKDAGWFQVGEDFSISSQKISNEDAVVLQTLGQKALYLKNTTGAGIKFNATTVAQSSKSELQIKNIKITPTEDSKAGYTSITTYVTFTLEFDWAWTNGSGSASDIYGAVDLKVTHEYWTWGDKSDAYTYTAQFNIVGGQTSGHCKFELGENEGMQIVMGGTDTYTIHGIRKSGTSNAYSTSSFVYYTTDTSGTNKTLYSLGSFCPNTTSTSETTGFFLGDDNHVWNTIRAYTALISTSDARVKTDVNNLTTAHDILFDNLRPVSYKYINGDSKRTHVGFIAQEVEKGLQTAGIDNADFAGLCIGKDENSTYALRYEEFIPLNTAQIQKLKKQIAAQDARIEELERIVKELKT